MKRRVVAGLSAATIVVVVDEEDVDEDDDCWDGGGVEGGGMSTTLDCCLSGVVWGSVGWEKGWARYLALRRFEPSLLGFAIAHLLVVDIIYSIYFL